MILLAQAAAVDPMQWVGQLPAPVLIGVLLYYVLTKSIPKMQDRFHEQLDKEREAREKIADKMLDDHKQAITKIIERDEVRTEKIVGKLDELPSKLRCGP